MPKKVSNHRLNGGARSATRFSADSKPLGILGGGQLAQMLALRAHELGIKIAVLSEKESDPAAQVTSLWRKGKLSDPAVLKDFLKSCSVVTFESEFLDAQLLGRLAEETQTAIYPEPQHMAMIQDRLPQKELLLKQKLPTARFYSVGTQDEAKEAFEELGGKAVFKKRRFGYDGYGTFVVKSPHDLESFLPEIAKNPDGFIAEEFIPFKREVAVMIARSRAGDVTHFPFVETFQENSRCLWVKGPLRSSPVLTRLAKKLERFLSDMNYVGVMGVELFDTSKGLIINELAPRVHNSGHYSQDALKEDQFALHVKCVLGFAPAPVEKLAPGFAMWNLLGSSDREPGWKLPRDVQFHWYGKSENRPGRKMGHVNAIAATPDKALALLRKRRTEFDV